MAHLYSAYERKMATGSSDQNDQATPYIKNISSLKVAAVRRGRSQGGGGQWEEEGKGGAFTSGAANRVIGLGCKRVAQHSLFYSIHLFKVFVSVAVLSQRFRFNLPMGQKGFLKPTSSLPALF